MFESHLATHDQSRGPSDSAHFEYFAMQSVWRYAASVAGSAAICRSAYRWLHSTCGSTGISSKAREGRILTLKRMDNVLIVVDDLEAAKAFFIELGLKLSASERSERATRKERAGEAESE